MPVATHRTSEFHRPWLGTALLLGVLMGAALQLQQPRLWSVDAYLVLFTGGLLCCLLRGYRARPGRLRWMRACLMLVGAASVMFAQIGWRSVAFSEGALASDLEGRDLQIVGMISAMPQVRENGVRFRMEVESAMLDGRAVRGPELADLSWYSRGLFAGDDAASAEAIPRLVAGQRWAMQVRLKAPHGAANPFGFDYELWMWEQGVQATGYVGSRGGPRWIEDTWAHPVERLRQQVRDAIVDRLVFNPAADDAFRARAAGVLAALVTGDQRAIDHKDWDVFRTTGVAHLVSISGLHITMFAWLAGAAIGVLWRRSSWLCLRVPAQLVSMFGGVLLAGGYALFSGWGVPAQRTIFMLATVALLRLGGKRWPWPHVWLLACALVLLWDPWAMLQAGFWLSFVAVGILFASHLALPAQENLDDVVGWQARLLLFGKRHVAALLKQQGAVTLAVAPLTLLLFGQMSVVGLIANLFAIPWVTLVVLPLAFLGIAWHTLWVVALWTVQCFVAVLQWCAGLPLAQLLLPVAPLWAGVLAVCGGVWLALRLPWRVRVMALPCLLPALWWTPVRPAPGRFDLLAIDVGQGQSVLVRTAHHSLLYDAGPMYSADSDAGERVVLPLLRAMGERLDMLMLSHRDADHTGGAPAVLAEQTQAQLMASVEVGHRLWQGRPHNPCVAGHVWQWDGVRFEVLHPTLEVATQLRDGSSAMPKSNAMSCVLRITDTHGISALLAGDIEQAQEKALLARDALAPVSWLLVPHHGSKTSSSAAFLDTLRPGAAVVQSGYRNRFGHPAEEVMQRYRERQIPVLTTPVCGAVWWHSEQPTAWFCERMRSLRYWKHLYTNRGG
ncbi:DNA internalization-related competence protein ComEC/Rec2 [Diaphorobacter sp. HDW4A]|uniref:DNA internalization-related competence protein ComEC/Rec2 n=1 Tax=Diaphorobacter sp. HDW4A TaxID=2714924 RepID=UPI0014087D90|nr:DNA internalization-related competence protein ComEC/Rec2 [Diaphorobacter sp. HDW4A]QIL81258.1 DNA internalization-related competence protein ComEC/Rec2 [Diaphorobacter sp. HDW4A]